MKNSMYGAYTDALFKSLDMLKVKHIFDEQCLKLWYKFVIFLICCSSLQYLMGKIRTHSIGTFVSHIKSYMILLVHWDELLYMSA